MPIRRLPLLAALCLAAAALVASPSARAQEVLSPKNVTPPAGAHPFGPADLWAMHRLSSPVPSPDGKWIVYVEKWYDVAANSSTSNLWLVSADGQTTRRLTSTEKKDWAPTWSPDGRTIAFVSNRSGASRIWAIGLAGGEAWPMHDLPVDVDDPRWSPKGDAIAFSAEVYPDEKDLAATAARDKRLADDPVKASIYDSTMIRHWDAWETGKRKHLFVSKVIDDRSLGDPVDLLPGAAIDAPTRTFGGLEEYGWSPDGKEIAFTGKEKSRDATRTDTDIYLAKADGSGGRNLTNANEAVDTGPVFSPDGKTIAYRRMTRPGYESDRLQIALIDRAGGKSRDLAAQWDRSPDEMVWSSDGKTLFVTAEDRARKLVFSVDATTGAVARLTTERSASGLDVARAASGDRLVVLIDGLQMPAELFTLAPNGSELGAITRVNAARLEKVRMSKPDEFWFVGAGGDSVHGWALPPVGAKAGKKYPIALLIHGGPQGSQRDMFHYRWNPQCFTGAGYGVVQIDFHGSTGYGQAFTDAINRDWGGKPYEDIMAGLDHAVATYSYLDGKRACALGASYGGFMVYWMAGHTDRFRCMVSHDGSFDEVSAYYGTEELWFPEWEWGGPPWTDARAAYEANSPERFVKNWKTPMLVIHGAKDYRLPETESFSAFNALQRLGVPSRLLYLPDENHWVLKPLNSILWHETIFDWLARYSDDRPGSGSREKDKETARRVR